MPIKGGHTASSLPSFLSLFFPPFFRQTLFPFSSSSLSSVVVVVQREFYFRGGKGTTTKLKIGHRIGLSHVTPAAWDNR